MPSEKPALCGVVVTLDRGAARRRCDAATEGPWVDGTWPEWSTDHLVSAAVMETWEDTDGTAMQNPVAILEPPNPMPLPADREFIAAARTDLPAALDLLDAAERDFEAVLAAGEGRLQEHAIARAALARLRGES